MVSIITTRYSYVEGAEWQRLIGIIRVTSEPELCLAVLYVALRHVSASNAEAAPTGQHAGSAQAVTVAMRVK